MFKKYVSNQKLYAKGNKKMIESSVNELLMAEILHK